MIKDYTFSGLGIVRGFSPVEPLPHTNDFVLSGR